VPLKRKSDLSYLASSDRGNDKEGTITGWSSMRSQAMESWQRRWAGGYL